MRSWRSRLPFVRRELGAAHRADAVVLPEHRDGVAAHLHQPRVGALADVVGEVRRLLETNDRTRESYVRHFYRTDPASARHYHLVVDSTVLPLETVVDLVVTAARARGIGNR